MENLLFLGNHDYGDYVKWKAKDKQKHNELLNLLNKWVWTLMNDSKYV